MWGTDVLGKRVFLAVQSSVINNKKDVDVRDVGSNNSLEDPILLSHVSDFDVVVVKDPGIVITSQKRNIGKKKEVSVNPFCKGLCKRIKL